MGMLISWIWNAMAREPRDIHALSLLTGSLDSQLAVQVLLEQGIRVDALVFTSPLYDTSAAVDAARQLGVPLIQEDFTADLVHLLKSWQERDGNNVCPCGACRGAMIKKAAAMLEDRGYQFIATGEILDQRDATQTMEILRHLSQHSGCDGLVVRPLSAALLEETAPEKEGWLDRTKLLGLRGKCRSQLEDLAGQHSLSVYPQHSGLCRMMESNLRDRVKDVLRHEGIQSAAALSLLRLGRHFRLGSATRLVVGRNAKENVEIEGVAELYDLILKPSETPGPTGLMPFTATEEEIETAAAICARYADSENDECIRVRVRSPRLTRWFEVSPADEQMIEQLRI